MFEYIIKYKDLYLTRFNYSNLYKKLTDFRFDNCFENAIAFNTLKEAQDACIMIGIGKVYKHIDVYELIG